MNDELEKLLKAGTPTPWFVGGVRFKMDRSEWHGIMSYNEAKKQDDNVCLVGYDPRTGEGYADARLIVAAVNALPELVAKVKRLEAALHEVIGLDHHNMGPESRATKLARAALNQEGGQ